MYHHNEGSLTYSVIHWTICVLFLGLGLISDGSPIKPTAAPKEQASDCTTLIVTNERRLSPPKNGRGGSGGSAGCNPGRQAKKLPAAVSRLFREEVDNYPEDEIKLILKQTPGDVKDLYNVLNTRLDPNTNLTERAFYTSGDEDGYMEREENVCKTVTRNIYPREANLHNSLVYIANNQDFMQVIQAEICQHPEQDCSYLRDNLPYGFISSCVQKYSYKKLLYMNPLDKRLATDLFRYPSCCVCIVRTVPLDLRSSTGGNQSLATRPSSSTSTTTTSVSYATSDIENSGESVAQYTSGNNSLSAAQQASDRSYEPQATAPNSARRHSKHLKQPTNQTVILSDDKVYTP